MSLDLSTASNSSLHSLVNECSNSTATFAVAFAINTLKIALIVPIYMFVLYLGHQQWKKQHSFTTTSHSDIFTYNVAAFQLLWLTDAICFYLNGNDLLGLAQTSSFFSYLTCYGENFFHIITCVERYLAVVHPITYMDLKTASWIRIRNIIIGCIWLLSILLSGVTTIYLTVNSPLPFVAPFCLSLLAVSFCSYSVLRVLINHGPGDRGKDQVDLAKKKAFITITAIMVVLWLWLGVVVISYIVSNSPYVSPNSRCLVMTFSFMFSLPSSLVLPLLYLHRAGKLQFCF